MVSCLSRWHKGSATLKNGVQKKNIFKGLKGLPRVHWAHWVSKRLTRDHCDSTFFQNNVRRIIFGAHWSLSGLTGAQTCH